jgi:hypothetical protein
MNSVWIEHRLRMHVRAFTFIFFERNKNVTHFYSIKTITNISINKTIVNNSIKTRTTFTFLMNLNDFSGVQINLPF